MKVILITNGEEDLSKALAKRLAIKHTVIISSSFKERIEKKAQELKCDSVVMDVTDPNSIKKAIKYILDTYGSIDFLINNNGVLVDGWLENNDEKEIRKVIENNLLGPIFTIKAVLPIMKAQKGGLIVNINTENGFGIKKIGSVNSLANNGINSFNRVLQHEIKEYSIIVTELLYEKVTLKLPNKIDIKEQANDIMYIERAVDATELILSMSNGIAIPKLSIRKY